MPTGSEELVSLYSSLFKNCYKFSMWEDAIERNCARRLIFLPVKCAMKVIRGIWQWMYEFCPHILISQLIHTYADP